MNCALFSAEQYVNLLPAVKASRFSQYYQEMWKNDSFEVEFKVGVLCGEMYNHFLVEFIAKLLCCGVNTGLSL